ncbi:MAG: DUF58 domain-containing protein [Calditrichaceae bacterium]|nr:DUF58 domain-containing protein [Calditrichaceae bacterium]
MQDNQLLKYLQPEVISSVKNLELVARLVVEGYLTGRHRSPFHGFSVEFSQHRPYMPGDNLRFIDWKVFGRTDRYYIKQFEEETNLRCHILLDVSKSMQYASDKITKAQYASYLTAGLTFLMLQQRDSTGLVLFDDKIKKIVPPRSVISHLNVILQAVNKAEYGNDTNISMALHSLAEQIRKRGLIILISDLLDDPQALLNGLKHFRHNKHEILVFHIIDRKELEFDFSGDVLFEDIESNDKLKTQPRYIQEIYKQKFAEYLEYLKVNFSNNRIDYQQLFTHTPFDIALTEYLLKRKRMF